MKTKFEAMPDAVLKAKLLAKTTSDDDKAIINVILLERAEGTAEAPKQVKVSTKGTPASKAAAAEVRAAKVAASEARAQAKFECEEAAAAKRAEAKVAKVAAREANRVARVAAITAAAETRAKLKFPLTGSVATYKVNPRKRSDETTATGKIIGITLDKRVSMFLVKIETPTGLTHKTLDAIVEVAFTPEDGQRTAGEILSNYANREFGLGIQQKLGDLDKKIAALHAKRIDLSAKVEDYANSDSAKEWEAAVSKRDFKAQASEAEVEDDEGQVVYNTDEEDEDTDTVL